MSTNYYLDSPDNDAGHIGKRTSGYFIAKAPEGVNSFDEWTAALQGHRIFAEYGIEYTPDELVAITEPEPGALVAQRRPRDGEFMERGVLFVRYEFC